MEFKTFIFDMDGTLLNTLPDLVIITNKALASVGFPERSEEEILGFVGSGARALINLAVPQEASEEMKERVIQNWKNLYPDFGTVLTKPYPGIIEAVAGLRARGAKTAVLSNKYDAAVKLLTERYFPDLFDTARGECAEIRRKPDPSGLLKIIEELGAIRETVAYVGDSHTDVETAANAGVFCIGVDWGYGGAVSLKRAGADAIISEAPQLLDFVRPR